MDALRDEIRHLDTTPRALRQFGVLVGGVFGAIAVFIGWRAGWDFPTWAAVMGGVGLALVVFGLVAPRVLRGPYVAWMGLAVVLGFAVSRVLLTLVFGLLVTPIGLVLRALGRAPFPRRPDARAATYWHAREAGPPDPARYGRFY